MISINGWQVPGYDTKINCGVKLAGEDLSGAGSYLISTDSGVKAAVLSVTTNIPFVDHKELAQLITKAKDLDENGARKIYTVNSDVASAYKVRKVKFDGEVKTNEAEDVKGWIITFKLLEVLSKSEREQQQLDNKTNSNINAQVNDGHNNVLEQFEKVTGV